MQLFVVTLLVLFVIHQGIAMNRSDVVANALVSFHWSESNKMRNNTKYGADVRRRSAALDGQLATIMEPPFGPFWVKNPRRIVIQSLDDPDIILAVKQRNLQLEERIKIHLFYAKNDSSTSDEYLEKEKRVLSNNNYTAAHCTAHPDDKMGTTMVLGADTFVNEYLWYSFPILTHANLLPPHREHTLNRLKVSIKSFLSRSLHSMYAVEGSRSSIVDFVNNHMDGYSDQFRKTHQIQMKAIVRHNGTYQDMEWLRNDLIDIKWVAQAMHMIHYQLTGQMQARREHTSTMMEFERQTIPMFNVIFPLIERAAQNIASQTSALDGPGFSRSQTRAERLRVMGRLTSSIPMQEMIMLSEMREESAYFAKYVTGLKEMVMIGNIGTSMAVVHRSIFVGSSVAIMVPGDFIPNLDRLEPLLYRIIKKFGWKYKCELEVTEI